MTNIQDPVLTVYSTAHSLQFLSNTIKNEGVSHILKALGDSLLEAGTVLDDAVDLATIIEGKKGLKITKNQ